MFFSELRNEQIRVAINLEQAFEGLLEAKLRHENHYTGSMSWKQSKGKSYLYFKKKGIWKSIGPKTPETERQYTEFTSAKSSILDAIKAHNESVSALALQARSMRLGRVPKIVAEILRKLDAAHLLGKNVFVAGTNCLYAYEAAASVRFLSELIATEDVDLLFDARTKLKLSIGDDNFDGVMAMLKSIDPTFIRMSSRPYTAINNDGFMVDLITPIEQKDVMRPRELPIKIGNAPDELNAVEIEGLSWLLSTPNFVSMAVGEDGYPVRMICPDPRAFAMHKLWLSERGDRSPGKRARDRSQAIAVANLATERLSMVLDDPALASFPKSVRDAAIKALVPNP